MLPFVVLLLWTPSLAQDSIKPDCSGGACPAFFEEETGNENSCRLWLGPSPIKNAEEHGFGLGIFTGMAIRKGQTVESLYGGAEPLLPLYGSETIYASWPPLREYMWDEDNMPEVAIEYPIGLTALFIPGLASIAPCTSVNYNLEMAEVGKFGTGRGSVHSNNEGIHRAKHATVGSFAYRNNVTYVAVRDIVPGEELTVQCSDDDYDGGAYYLSRYKQEDNAVVCLDQNLIVKPSKIEGSVGQGLHAKRNLPSDQTIISSPLIPIHRKEMDISDEDVNTKQLMLNYCYGHPDSDLLLLPYGPLFNYVNHSPTPNARIRWHEAVKDNSDLKRREQHHHLELFDISAEEVAETHGKSLLMDIVALRDISEGEEVTIDYGEAWRNAWDSHVADWEAASEEAHYMAAEDYNKQQQGTVIRTVQEQRHSPYPENMEAFCFYQVHNYDPTRELQTFSWDEDFEHNCFRPCVVLERYQKEISSDNSFYYTIELLPQHDERVIEHCVIGNNPYVVSDVPQEAIRVVDRPYTTDVFLLQAFRHEISVPQGMYPENWKRKKLRSRKSSKSQIDGDEFKRRKSVEVSVKG